MFIERLLHSLEDSPPLVIGVDPDLSRIRSLYPDWVNEMLQGLSPHDSNYPQKVGELYWEYCSTIIEAVHDLVPAVKIQSAFFEVWGHQGIRVLEKVIDKAYSHGLLVINDVKRGDVPSTAEHYASAYLDPTSPLSSDAITVNPYLGRDSWEPFFRRCLPPTSAGLFVLVKTSNPGSGDLQDLIVNEKKLSEHLSGLLDQMIDGQAISPMGYSNVGAVVGATYSEDAKRLRQLLPHSFFLVPGLGSQGGELQHIPNYLNPDGRGALFNVSRSIIYPNLSPGYDGSSWGRLRQDIRATAIKWVEEIRSHLPKR